MSRTTALPSGRNGYRQYTDIQNDLKKIVADHPAIARPVTLPKKTFQGRDITGIEVTDNVNATDDGKPVFFLIGVHHAREWPSAEIPVELGLYLTKNFGRDSKVQMNSAPLVEIKMVLNFTVPESQAIVDYRDKNGGLKGAEEMASIPGVDAAKIQPARARMAF